MSAEPLPKSVSRSEVVVAGVVLVVHQLDNGERIIERDSLLELLEAMKGNPLSPCDSDILVKATRG